MSCFMACQWCCCALHAQIVLITGLDSLEGRWAAKQDIVHMLLIEYNSMQPPLLHNLRLVSMDALTKKFLNNPNPWKIGACKLSVSPRFRHTNPVPRYAKPPCFGAHLDDVIVLSANYCLRASSFLQHLRELGLLCQFSLFLVAHHVTQVTLYNIIHNCDSSPFVQIICVVF